MIATTESPGLSPRRSTDALEIIDTTSDGGGQTMLTMRKVQTKT